MASRKKKEKYTGIDPDQCTTDMTLEEVLKDSGGPVKDLPEGEPIEEGEFSQEGALAQEGQPSKKKKLSTKQQKKMLAALDLADQKVQEPSFDPKTVKSIHTLNDFSPNPTRYARRQRLKITISRAGKPEVKKNITGYLLFEHRDVYDTHAAGRRIQVESDKTTIVIVANFVDIKNVIGRNLRKAGMEPVTTLKDTLIDGLGLDIELEGPDDG